MFSALFPVHKDVTTDVLPCAETPGSFKSGGDGEEKEQFARLLFVSLENAGEAEKKTAGTSGGIPLWTNGTRSLTSLPASFLGENTVPDTAVLADAADEEPSSQTVPDDSLASLFASAFTDAKGNMAQFPTPAEAAAAEVASENEAFGTLQKQMNTAAAEFPSPKAQLLDEALIAKEALPVDAAPPTDATKGLLKQAASPESTHPHDGGKGAFALPDSFKAVTTVDPEIEDDALGRLQSTAGGTTVPAQEALQPGKGQAEADTRAAMFPVATEAAVYRTTGQTGDESRQPETFLHPSFPKAASQEAGNTPEIPDASSAYARRPLFFTPSSAATTETDVPPENGGLKTENPGVSVPFSLSMTDNVRPRRNFVLTEPDAPVAESDAETAEASSAEQRTPFRPRILSAASSQSPETKNAEKPVTDLSAATASERALKAAVEEKLSTHRLTEGREQGIFPAARNLFGEAETGKSIVQEGTSEQLSGKPFSILKESLKSNDFNQQPGKEAAESAVYSASPKPMQSASQQQVSFANLLSGETQLQGRGGAALEDGMQHVVRFLRTEGRQAASIIVDPPALGRIEIELVTIGKGVEASIKVASEQVRQLVQDHITVLRNHLEQQGVHLGEFVVDLRDNSKGNSGRNTFSGEGNPRRRGTSVSETESIDETVPSFRVDLEHGLLSWVA